MTKRYTQEIHQAALKRHFIGEQTAAQIGRELKIPRQTIGAWITTAKFGLKGSEWTPRRIRELCRKVKRLEDIIAVLKTVDCTVHSPTQERLDELERLYGCFSNHVLCDALDVPRGTFLNHIRRNKRDANSYRERRELLKGRVSSIHDAAHQRFGAGKIAAKLKYEGIRVSKEMVHELMLEMGLSSVRTKAKAIYRTQLRQMRNIVMRDFNTSAPNMTWVSDVTEFHYKNVTVPHAHKEGRAVLRQKPRRIRGFGFIRLQEIFQDFRRFRLSPQVGEPQKTPAKQGEKRPIKN